MLRHKHYALPQMRLRAGRYVVDKELSYRRSVTESSLPIFRWDGDLARVESSERSKETEKTQTLAHTTVYRWITTLGGLVPPTARKSVPGIAERKCRTKARKKELIACLRFCRAKAGRSRP
jgi:hypothetical protein